MTRKLQLEAHYLYSYSATYSMFFGEPNTGIPNEWNDTGRAERGPSDFYQRHRFVANGLVELPYRMQFSMIATVGSGLPVNPVTGVDNNGDTYSFDRPVGLGRNSYRTPMQSAIDVSIAKQWKLKREGPVLEFRGEVFNVLNRNNYLKVNNVWGDGTRPGSTFLAPVAGISNVDPSRQFQIVLRLTF